MMASTSTVPSSRATEASPSSRSTRPVGFASRQAGPTSRGGSSGGWEAANVLDAALGHGMGSVMGAPVHDRGVVLARNERDNGHPVCSERDLAPFGEAEQSRTPTPDATLGELRAMAEQQVVVIGRVRSLQHPADHAGGLVSPGAASQPSGALRPSRADLLAHPPA